jgi:acyl-CoA synthetase (AMP-forming)/AMP-acid ligase II
MKDSGAKCMFTCLPLLDTALKAAKAIGMPKDRIYILELPLGATDGKASPKGYKTVNDLIEQGKGAPDVEPLKWGKGEGARRTAFLCYSSGTSGLPVSESAFT